MPISYSLDAQRGLILSHWTGIVTTDDLAAHWRKLFSDAAALVLRRSLSDLRGADLQISGEDVMRLTLEIIRPVASKGAWLTAMIVDRPDVFGVGRQIQAYADMFQSSAIFTDEATAMAWLLAQ